MKMLSAWTVASRVESAGFSATVKLPSTSVKRPRTFVPTRWRATKPTSVWAGSIEYVPTLGRVDVLCAGHFGSPFVVARFR